MSKVIVVERCGDCPYAGGRDRMDCWHMHRRCPLYGIPNWCPLRPLPDKATPENSDMGISWNLGWNACLEAITGEVEV